MDNVYVYMDTEKGYYTTEVLECDILKQSIRLTIKDYNDEKSTISIPNLQEVTKKEFLMAKFKKGRIHVYISSKEDCETIMSRCKMVDGYNYNKTTIESNNYKIDMSIAETKTLTAQMVKLQREIDHSKSKTKGR